MNLMPPLPHWGSCHAPHQCSVARSLIYADVRAHFRYICLRSNLSSTVIRERIASECVSHQVRELAATDPITLNSIEGLAPAAVLSHIRRYRLYTPYSRDMANELITTEHIKHIKKD